MKNFQTSTLLAQMCQYAGWVIIAICAIALLMLLSEGSSTAAERTINMAAYASGIVAGLLLILIGQLTEAQLAVAVNSGKILEMLQKHAAAISPPYNPAATSSAAPAPPQAVTQTEGRYLRSYNGFDLHKFDDGISVDGKGRFKTILEAEKYAKSLTENRT